MGDQSQKPRPQRRKTRSETTDAANQFIDSEDWLGLGRLIAEQASVILAEGQYHTLASWLHAMPAEIREEQQWLCYWTGTCEMSHDLSSARPWFERAFEKFETDSDFAGLYLSWASIIDTLFLEWRDFSPMRRWISIGEQLLDRHPPPPGEIEGRVTAAMFTALMHSDPAHPRIGEWVQRLSDQLARVPDDSARILMGASLVIYYSKWLGDHGRAQIELEKLACTEKRRERLAPHARIMLALLECTCAWSCGNIDEAHSACQEGMAVAEHTGVHQFDFLLHAQPVYVSLGAGDIDGAKRALAELKKFLPRATPIEQAHWHYLAAWRDMECGQPHIAEKRLKECTQRVSEGNAPFQHALHLIAIAQVRRECREPEEIPSLLAEARTFAAAIGSPLIEFMVRCCEAHFALESGNEPSGLAALREAFALGRRQGYLNHAWLRSKTLARLCIRALEGGIETDYARELVRTHRIAPETPPILLADWPWPLKVYTLGRFSVIRNGEPLRFSSKAQHKPMEMLKTLIALGGRKVPEARLSQNLWPEAEGDSAHSAFTTTLSRLRKLIGDESLYVRDSCLTLDARRCWVDVWAFERTLGEAETAATVDAAEVFMRKAIGFYHGPFLAAEDDAPGFHPLRERLRNRLMRTVTICTHRLEKVGREHQAKALTESVTHL